MKRRMFALVICLVLCLNLPLAALAAGATYSPYGNIVDITVGDVTYYDIYGEDGERPDEMLAIFEQALTYYRSYGKGDIMPYYDSAAKLWNDVAHALYLTDHTNINIDGDDGHSFNERHWAIMRAFSENTNTNDVPYFIESNGDTRFADETGVVYDPACWIVNSKAHRSGDLNTNGVFAYSTLEDLADGLATEIGGFFEDYAGRKAHDNYQYLVSMSGSSGRDEMVKRLKNEGLSDKGPFFLSTQSVLAEYNDNGASDPKDDTQMMTWGAIFYDFSVEYLNTPATSALDSIVGSVNDSGKDLYTYLQDSGTTVPGITYEIRTDEDNFSVGGVNESSEAIDLTISYGTTVSESASNTRSHSEEYSFAESLSTTHSTSVSANIQGLFDLQVSMSMSAGFEATQMWSDTWENSESYSNSTSSTTSSKVQLPGHTQILLSTGEGNTAFTLGYDAPIAIRYKVLLFGNYFMHQGDDGDIKGESFRFLGHFGNSDLATGDNAHAAGNLYYRYHNGKNHESLYGQGIDWTEILSDPWTQEYISQWYGTEIYCVDLVDAINKIYTHQPYSVTGGNLSASVKSTNTTIYGLEPLYPLTKVTTDSAFDYDMTLGEDLYLDNIPLYGYNDANVSYYGFSSDKGQWKVVDNEGNEITSSVISITTNPLTGYSTLAAIGEGDAMIQYFIDEDVYSAANAVAKATNDTVQRVAIPVHVTSKPFEGSIAISGNLEHVVGDAPAAISEHLTAAVMDTSGKEVNRAITWDAQELNGILVENNMISFTAPGTYHVRATVGNATSEWYEVTALPARQLTTITIPETQEIDVATGSYNYQIGDMFVELKDQYGAAWNENWKDTASFTMHTPNGSTLIMDAYDTVVINAVGDYTLTMKIGDVVSNVMTITVIDTTPGINVIEPAATELSPAGGEVEFTILGTYLPEGIELNAGNGITATTTGTDTEQKATLTFPANTSTTEAVTYTITNSLDSSYTATVTVAIPQVTSITPAATVLTPAGGDVEFTVTGIYLSDGITIRAGEGISATTTGTDTEQKATLTFPANDSKTDPVVYTVTNDLNGNCTAAVTVEIPRITAMTPASGSVSSDGGTVVITITGTNLYDGITISAGKDISAATTGTADEQKATLTFPANPSKVDPVKYTITNDLDSKVTATVIAETTCISEDYSDLDTSQWYHEVVDYVLTKGIMGGYGNGTFGPEDKISRAQFAQILYNLENKPAYTNGTTFTDVAESDWYYDAVSWASAEGIVNGYSDGRFGANDNITREQLTTMLWRYAQAKGYDVSFVADPDVLTFTDAASVSEYALTAMQWAFCESIINGMGDGVLNPTGLATRAQAAAMISRFCSNVVN